jgi:hypothetical protein
LEKNSRWYIFTFFSLVKYGSLHECHEVRLVMARHLFLVEPLSGGESCPLEIAPVRYQVVKWGVRAFRKPGDIPSDADAPREQIQNVDSTFGQCPE